MEIFYRTQQERKFKTIAIICNKYIKYKIIVIIIIIINIGENQYIRDVIECVLNYTLTYARNQEEKFDKPTPV